MSYLTVRQFCRKEKLPVLAGLEYLRDIKVPVMRAPANNRRLVPVHLVEAAKANLEVPYERYMDGLSRRYASERNAKRGG